MVDCEIRKHFVEKYGEQAGCANPHTSWDDCAGKCKIVSKCPMCGHPRLQVGGDPCLGVVVLCVNPECGMDK